jgi:hypothetical protein
LFPGCSVRDGGFADLSDRRVLSFPVGGAAGAVLDLYTEVAEGFAADFPPVTAGPLANLGGQLGLLGQAKSRFYGTLDKLISAERGPEGKQGRYLNRSLIAPASRLRMTFAEAYRFYDRPGERDPLGEDQTPPPPDVHEFDFHEFVAYCGDYPKLLRPLGIALDFLVDFLPGSAPTGRIRVEVGGPPAFESWMSTENARPWTQYEISDRRFVPRSRNKEADLADGELRLESSRLFLINQFDVDGSALKVVDFAGNVSRLSEHLNEQQRSMGDDAASAPALRSAGFTIARDRRAERVVKHLDTAADHEGKRTGGKPAELAAEDVTRGYRLDVEDTVRPNRWRSLHARTGRYEVKRKGHAAVPLPIGPDEAYVKGASATSVPGNDDLYLHEALFGWDGWSLAAKRPGSAITNTGTEDVKPQNPTEFPLFTEFEATPGTLPRLRFGRTYRFRARAVDLAGNSVRRRDLLPQHTSEPHTFRRFDPVPSPAIVPRRPFTEGESLLRMVIRSTLDVLPESYVRLQRIRQLVGHTDPLLTYRAANERHLAPPLASQQLAEWHGMFDDAVGIDAAQSDVDEQFDVAALESGSFLDPTPGAGVFNPTGAKPTDLADPKRTKGAPLKSGEYVYHDTNDLELPYLPDPLSVGTSFTKLPGDAGTRLQPWEAGPEWYDLWPLRLRIEDGNGVPDYDAGKRLLTVFLPQAEIASVRVSSFLDPGDLELMSIWMLEQPAVRAAQRTLAEQGRHWMLTPWQVLTLVHAVEKPLQPPVIDVPPGGVQRGVGEGFAVLAGTVDNHARSTGKLELVARWEEPIDDLNRPAPTTIEGNAHVADFELLASEDACRIGRDDVPASGSSPAVHKVRHEFHDTKHRWVNYRATATTRFREYFTPEITNDRSLITHSGPETLLDVPSSRRPDPPAVLYVVPTWTWTEENVRGLSLASRGRRLASTRLRTRSGGGLRVYLDRPWYSSGADELLGVVLENQPWITWPIDVAGGLTIEATTKATADEFARLLIEQKHVRPGGRASQPPSERVLAAIDRIRSRQPRVSAQSLEARSLEEQVSASHAAAETSALARKATQGVASFSDAQLEALGNLIGTLFLPSGDPQKFVTHWGLDPIWGTAPIDAGPYIHQFPLRVAVGTDVSLLEAPGNVATVVGHQPQFDDVRKLWYCDLQLDAGHSYTPFVRLALARYQPHSISGQHLSPIVFPDFAQLIAERSAAATRIGRSALAVSLRGPGGYTQNAFQLSPPLGGDLAGTVALSRFAVAQIERLSAKATTDLAWLPVGDEIRLDVSLPRGLADVRYSGTVPLPPTKSGEQLRVALREYEIFETDASEADDHITRPLAFADFVVLDRPVRYRLVYADNLPV